MPPAQDLPTQVSALIKAGRAPTAVKLVETLIRKTPGDIRLWLLLAQVHGRGTGRYDLTLKAAKQAIKIGPKDHRGWLEAAQALDRLERFREAATHIEKAKKLAPKDADVGFSQALILANLNEVERAETILRKLHKQRPTHVQTRVQLAMILVRRGALDEAQDIARALREDHPDTPAPYSILGAAGIWQADDPALQYLENTLIPKMKSANSLLVPQLVKTLAKAKNDIKDYDAAITLWTEAKKIEGRTHDAARYDRFVDTLCKSISRATYLGNPGLKDDRPVLIVGMPRSGSTLLAQILSAHPQVASAGESPAARLTLAEHGVMQLDVNAQLALLKGLTKDGRDALGTRYLNKISAGFPDAKRIVDKRLHNFENLAVLAAALPNARIIHALRDPMDTCVSCYMQKLPIAHGYTGDLAQLGQYYGQYRRLMDHWAKVLPNPMMTVKYEDVVADTETRARALIDFLGLDWDPACLAFQDNETQVKTLSNWQVRQPIYKSSVQRWRRYDAHLGPLKDALAPFYPNGLD